MPCNYCLRDYGHNPRCPLYKDKKSYHYCSICGDGILEGEEYIENENGEYRHWECFDGMRDLLEWLGYEIKTMEDE